MPRHLSYPQATALVRSRAELERYGWGDGDIRRAVRDGSLRRVQRNRYVDGADWDACWADGRHRLQIAAAVAEMRDGPAVVSHASAAVLHGLPLYRHVPDAVHVTVAASTRMSRTTPVRRHHDRLAEADVVTVDGVSATSLDRTVLDVLRLLPAEAAIACADHAMRATALVGRTYDDGRAEQWRASMRTRMDAAPGARGIRRARPIVEAADGRAESPTESVGRLQFIRLGFDDLVLQPEIVAAAGKRYRADLGVPPLRAYVEFDGRAKYTDVELRGGRTAEEVVFDEKRREDAVRAATGWRVVRVLDEHVRTPEALAAHLGTYGIRPR